MNLDAYLHSSCLPDEQQVLQPCAVIGKSTVQNLITQLSVCFRSPDTLPMLPQTQGCGNCANALTAAARLGLRAAKTLKPTTGCPT